MSLACSSTSCSSSRSPDEPERVRRAVDRDVVTRLSRYGQRADVVLVPVGDHDASDARAEAVERREVGVDDVDPEAAVVERDAAVDEQSFAALLDRHAVHADLAEASERKDADHGADLAQGQRSGRSVAGGARPRSQSHSDKGSVGRPRALGQEAKSCSPGTAQHTNARSDVDARARVQEVAPPRAPVTTTHGRPRTPFGSTTFTAWSSDLPQKWIRKRKIEKLDGSASGIVKFWSHASRPREPIGRFGVMRWQAIAACCAGLVGMTIAACGSSDGSMFSEGGGEDGGAVDPGSPPSPFAPPTPSDDAGSDKCKPRTCAEANANCGPISDGCEGIVQCGTTCPDGETCGGAGVPSQCGKPACTPRTCAQLGVECGAAGDGCGNALACGACEAGSCGGGGPSKCGGGSGPGVDGGACVPTKTACGPGDCGFMPDGCGDAIDCTMTACAPGQTCGGGGTADQCGAPPCAPLTCGTANCGFKEDGCGGLLNCWPAGAPRSVGRARAAPRTCASSLPDARASASSSRPAPAAARRASRGT